MDVVIFLLGSRAGLLFELFWRAFVIEDLLIFMWNSRLVNLASLLALMGNLTSTHLAVLGVFCMTLEKEIFDKNSIVNFPYILRVVGFVNFVKILRYSDGITWVSTTTPHFAIALKKSFLGKNPWL